MPKGAVYIDLLLPISVDDEGYVGFNSENGEFYSISKDSEIVNFCKDGYRSYTFHISDAWSSIRPQYMAEFQIEKDVYLDNLLEFLPFESYCTSGFYANVITFCADIGYQSEKESQLNALSDSLGMAVYRDLEQMELLYNCDSEKDERSKYDFEYCCKKYKFAKVAYLDEQGNIIAVTDEVKIYKPSLSDVQLYLKLSGTNFSSDPHTVPRGYIGFVVIAELILISGFLISLIVKKI